MRLEIQLQSIVEDLPRTYARFYDASPAARTCSQCGTVHPGRDWATWLQACAKTWPQTAV
jgi:3-hydroxyanthranilate 3,4-dioxygenase